MLSPNYLQYLMIDQNSRTYSGIVTAESAASVTLRRGGDAKDTILCAHIREMKPPPVDQSPVTLVPYRD